MELLTCDLCFSVRDTGIGIPPDAQARIFDAFAQADDSTTRKYGGTGLGLSIARQLVSLMHGEIGVTSAVGQGTLFWFTARFKVTEPSIASDEKQIVDASLRPEELLDGSLSWPIDVLLAEDNPINQQVTRRLLETFDCRVSVAANGRQALEALRRTSYTLILLDCQMPEMDGFTATRAIRQREESTSAHIPIIALTAHAMRGDRERCLAAGMDAYLSKPLQAHQLFEAIERLALPATRDRVEGADGSEREPAGVVFDQQVALARVEGDQELLQEIVGLFLVETPVLQSVIRESIARQDGKALEQAAHSVKGAMSSFGAQAAHEAALKLEVMGREGDLTQAALACAELEREIAHLTQALAVYRGEPGP
jgi:CheY-like chemotaxis protein